MYFCGCIYALRECGPTPVSSFTPTPHLATTESTWRLQLQWFLWCHCVDSRCCRKANCSLWTEKHGRTLFVHNFMLSMKSSNYRPLSLAVLYRPTSYPADLRWHYSSSITCSNFSAGLELHFRSHISKCGTVTHKCIETVLLYEVMWCRAFNTDLFSVLGVDSKNVSH